MDITYLLWLQDLRNGMNDAWTPFMEWISYFGIRNIILLPVFVYWCLDKHKGEFILAAWKISQTINSIVKLTACVYRPWVRDARIIPAGDSIKTAGGYSFPSGHTMMATPIYGGLATITKSKLARMFWVALILITMFSRNYLGVHTPQDVLVGAALGVLSIYIAQWMMNYLDRKPEKRGLVMSALFAAGVLTMVYVTYKPYPMDYVDGKLLVDPVKMQIDAWGDAGGLPVIALAWYIERRWINFTPTGLNFKGVILGAIGLVILAFMTECLKDPLKVAFGQHLGKFAYQVVFFFYVMILWPLVLKLFSRGSKS
ncbi:MAG: phosphatase PAP2 family protein [Synergistaceae bacterium]|nr:phosphatase PAP2 family protein [Synergistaceae bacterium]